MIQWRRFWWNRGKPVLSSRRAVCRSKPSMLLRPALDRRPPLCQLTVQPDGIQPLWCWRRTWEEEAKFRRGERFYLKVWWSRGPLQRRHDVARVGRRGDEAFRRREGEHEKLYGWNVEARQQCWKKRWRRDASATRQQWQSNWWSRNIAPVRWRSSLEEKQYCLGGKLISSTALVESTIRGRFGGP